MLAEDTLQSRQRGLGFERHKVRVAKAVVSIKQGRYALIHHAEQFVDGDAINFYFIKQLWIGRDFDEGEATTQGDIQRG
ncbi:hypothetical protein ALP75_200886 [Pseudomonas syringae pv. actinidiae]|nr:hypothetical protein ALP75_200886 [Pseudomonas syringae pv. actinidiae]